MRLLCLPSLQSLHRWRGGYPDRERECVPEEKEWRAPLFTSVPPPRSAVHPLLLWRSTAQHHASSHLKTLLSRHQGELQNIEDKRLINFTYFCWSKEGSIILTIFLIIILYMYRTVLIMESWLPSLKLLQSHVCHVTSLIHSVCWWLQTTPSSCWMSVSLTTPFWPSSIS